MTEVRLQSMFLIITALFVISAQTENHATNISSVTAPQESKYSWPQLIERYPELNDTIYMMYPDLFLPESEEDILKLRVSVYIYNKVRNFNNYAWISLLNNTRLLLYYENISDNYRLPVDLYYCGRVVFIKTRRLWWICETKTHTYFKNLKYSADGLLDIMNSLTDFIVDVCISAIVTLTGSFGE